MSENTSGYSPSSTMQSVIGPIRISHLYQTFLIFIFSWPYDVLQTPKFKP